MKITIRNLPAFTACIDRLNRRARRLALPEITFTATGERTEKAPVKTINESGHTVTLETVSIIVHDIEIHNIEPVRLNGWSFAAVLEPVGAGENLILARPGCEPPARYTKTGCYCDHCRTDRARLKTYLLHHESGDWRQVGSTCLSDFIGHTSAESIASHFAFYGELWQTLAAWPDNESALMEQGGGIARAYSVADVVAATLATIARHGYTSNTAARENGATPTSDYVKASLRERDQAARIQPTAEHEQAAEELIAYFANLPAEQMERTHRRAIIGQNEAFLGYEDSREADSFLHTLQTLCRAGFCSFRTIGLACAIPAAADRHRHHQEREAAKERQRATAQHLGTIGQRLTVTGRIQRIVTYETAYGLAVKAIIEDDAGNVFFGSLPSLKDGILNQGDAVQFSCAIKEHATRDGIAQNKFSRPTKARRL